MYPLEAFREALELTGGVPLDDLRNHILRVKLEALTGNPNLTSSQMNRIVELLDEVSPRSVFRELDDELKKMLSQAKSG